MFYHIVLEEVYHLTSSLFVHQTSYVYSERHTQLESSWSNKNWTVIAKRDGELGLIAERSSLSAHAYIFITHRSKERILDELDEGISPIRGIAATGSACSTGIGIIEYLPDSARNSGMQNAEVFW